MNAPKAGERPTQPAPRIGDTVHVRGVVRGFTATEAPQIEFVAFAHGKRILAYHNVPWDQIVHFESRPLAVGDKVLLENGTIKNVLALGAVYAWLGWPGTVPVTRLVADLVRA